MGFFNFGRKKRQKEVDQKIENARTLLAQDDLVSAFLALKELQKESDDYRAEEIEELLAACETAMAKKVKGEQAPAEPVDFSAPAEEEWFAIEDDVPPVPEEVPLTEIDGKDGETWMREAAAYYEKEKYTPALECMENAAKLGVAQAMHNISIMYSLGLGTRADKDKSFYWCKKGAEAGYCESMFQLSNKYYKGEGTEKDDDKTFYWRKRAAEEGDQPKYWFVLAHAYENGLGCETDLEQAFHCLKKAAEGGLSDAYAHCARRYDNGIGTAEDKTKALYWYEKAAESGDADAMMVCYHRYFDGVGTAQNFDKASEWLAKAYAAENAEAIYEVGKMQIEQGSEEERAEGYTLLEEAGKRGCVAAMEQLADDYSKTNADSKVEKDLEKAFYWYEKAAHNRSHKGIFNTFVCYFQGIGTEKDDEKAVKWLHVAVEEGVWDAPYHMAVQSYQFASDQEPELYENALYWAEIAAKGKHRGATQLLEELYRRCLFYEEKKEDFDIEKIVRYADGLIAHPWYETAEIELKRALLNLVLSRLFRRKEHSAYKEHVVRYLEMAAELEDVQAMRGLSMMYYTGELIPRDPEKAFFWCRKAVEYGHTESALVLAILYAGGIGCTKDLVQAFTYCKMAADNGEIEAYYMLADFYLNGTGCTADKEMAIRYYTMDIESGSSRAEKSKESLLLLYMDPNRSRKNHQKAHQLAQELADGGNPFGFHALGFLYIQGIGCTEDIDKGHGYYVEAAKLGYGPAFYALGTIYEEIATDEEGLFRAFAMYKRAAEQGVRGAAEKAEELEARGAR